MGRSVGLKEGLRTTNNGHLLVPVGEGHHDVEGGQEEAEVEERVAVGDSLLFVVHGPSDTVLPCHGLVGGQTLALLCPHQLVHLGVVRGADAAGAQGLILAYIQYVDVCFQAWSWNASFWSIYM